MEESKTETLDLSKRGLKKIEKAPSDESTTIINLILDQNELQRLDNIDTYIRVENLSICNNFLLRMLGVSKLTNIRVLALNNNGIIQIEGLKDLIYLKVLKLAGNNIKSIEHLSNNMHLEYLDLSNNQISFIADISYLKNLKHLNLERNRIIDLRQCDRYLPTNLEHFGVGHNNIQDLNEVSHLVHLNNLDSFTIQGNPCVSLCGKDKFGFDYRPFVLNWILSVKTIDGFVVSAIESLKAEWLYSQGKGRHFHTGQHQELCEYLASTCPLTADALETEDQRKLRLILSKAQHHQQQLKDTNNSPIRSRLQSPRMQSRIVTARHMGRSPDRLTSSFHSALSKPSAADVMSHSFDSPGLMYANAEKKEAKEKAAEPIPPQKPVNQALEAASKMVPVPESLMSPDYQDPIYDIQRTIPKPSSIPNSSSHSSNSSLQEEKKGQNTPRNLKGSPKLPKSATSSPKMRSKLEQRKSSLSSTKDLQKEDKKCNGSYKCEDKKCNGASKCEDKKCNGVENGSEVRSSSKRHKRVSEEVMAAVTIQKMWRGYRSRNLNKDTLRILHAIQAARARQHIQRLTCDMEATKAALESERKIQQLQMQAINALWKKVSTLQTNDCNKKCTSDGDDNTEVLRQLTETCFNLQTQVVELQSCMQEVLRAVSNKKSEPVATQTDIIAVDTPQEDRIWLKRPQSLPLSVSAAPSTPHSPRLILETPLEKSTEEPLKIERTESIINAKEDTPIDVAEEKLTDETVIVD